MCIRNDFHGRYALYNYAFHLYTSIFKYFYVNTSYQTLRSAKL